MQNEIEAKFFINSKDEIRKTLKDNKLSLYKPNFLMKRVCYKFNKNDKKYFRVRQEYDKITMTCKNIIKNTLKDVYENEIVIDNFDKGCEMLEQTGLILISKQESYREVWHNDEVEIMIDEWPYLQPYIEIEAESESIVKKYTKSLDFDFKNAFFGGVGVLYEKQYGILEKYVNEIQNFSFNDKSLLEILKTHN